MIFNLLLAAAALLGHGALWVWVFNTLHALALPCRAINLLEKVIYLVIAGAPLGIAAFYVEPRTSHELFPVFLNPASVLFAYLALCWLIAAYAVPVWLVQRIWPKKCPALRSDETRVIDVAERLGHKPVAGLSTRLLAALPGNEILTLHVHEKALALPNLPDGLAGMTIAHVTDLHFTGGVTRDYFDQVIDEANAFDCDWTLVTGDILDTDDCMDWVPHTVGRLRARQGVLFVLGNHDRRRADHRRLRRVLADCGLVDVGGKWIERDFRGEPILFAGTEIPWFGPAPDMSAAPPPHRDGGPFRILLSHSPDQYRWARRRQFDLMFAGHTHGGQIRLPLIGALISPSVHGTKYAAGVFEEPPTVMHVSRGVSGLHPLRFNCPPELTKLTLCCASDRSRRQERSDAAALTSQIT